MGASISHDDDDDNFFEIYDRDAIRQLNDDAWCRLEPISINRVERIKANIGKLESLIQYYDNHGTDNLDFYSALQLLYQRCSNITNGSSISQISG